MAIPAIAAIATSLLDMGSQVINNLERRNAAFDERMYNTPAQQVQRLKDAGINPYALAPQIASNNTSNAFPAGSVSAGDSVQKGFNTYATQQQIQMQKAVNQFQVESMQEQIRGLKLDNQLKEQTLDDKAGIIKLKLRLSALDAQIKAGLITKQEYDNERLRILTDWTYYQAGLDNETFGNPADSFVGEESPMVANLNVDYRAKEAKTTSHEIDALLKDKMRASFEKQIKYSALKTEEDYLLVVQKVLRETEAAQFETTSHLPWNNKNLGVHIFESVLGFVGSNLSKYPDASFGQILLWSVCDYLGLPHPQKGKKRSLFGRRN